MNKSLLLVAGIMLAVGCTNTPNKSDVNYSIPLEQTSPDNFVGTWIIHNTNYKVGKDDKNKLAYITKLRGTEETYLFEFSGNPTSMMFSKRDANTLESINTNPDIHINFNSANKHIVIKYLDAERIWAEYRRLK